MRKHVVVLPLVLLAAAVTWSCQSDSAPLAADAASPAAKKGGGGKGGGSQATFTVDVLFENALVAQMAGAIASSNETQLAANRKQGRATLHLASPLGDCLSAGDYEGELAVHSGTDWVQAVFFHGLGLQVKMDAANPGDWLPAVSNSVAGTAVIVTYVTGKGKNKEVVCSDTPVPQVWQVVVTRE